MAVVGLLLVIGLRMLLCMVACCHPSVEMYCIVVKDMTNVNIILTTRLCPGIPSYYLSNVLVSTELSVKVDVLKDKLMSRRSIERYRIFINDHIESFIRAISVEYSCLCVLLFYCSVRVFIFISA